MNSLVLQIYGFHSDHVTTESAPSTQPISVWITDYDYFEMNEELERRVLCFTQGGYAGFVKTNLYKHDLELFKEVCADMGITYIGTDEELEAYELDMIYQNEKTPEEDLEDTMALAEEYDDYEC